MVLPEDKINDFQLDIPYERSEPEKYRTQHFPKPEKTLTLDEIWYLMEHAKVRLEITVKSILQHCYNFEDARLSLEQLRNNRREYF